MFLLLLFPVLVMALLFRKKPEPRDTVQLLAVDSCENITYAEMGAVAGIYPNVKIVCEKEKTVLYPSELDGPEFMSVMLKVAPKPYWFQTYFRGKTFYFTELARVLMEEQPELSIPVFPCAKVSENQGSGAIDVSLARSRVRSVVQSISGTAALPSYGLPITLPALTGSLLPGRTSLSESVDAFTCAFSNHSVRPFLQLARFRTKIRTRLWAVDFSKKEFIHKYGWLPSVHDEVSEETYSVACVSEKYVPGVCERAELSLPDPDTEDSAGSDMELADDMEVSNEMELAEDTGPPNDMESAYESAEESEPAEAEHIDE